MANYVIAQVNGGDRKVLDSVETVGDVRSAMGAAGYTATLNGRPTSDSESVRENDKVIFAQAAKGGTI